MSFSTTGLAYLLGSVTMALLVNRFYIYWQHQKTVVSKLFVLFLATLNLFFLVAAVSGIFFAGDAKLLKTTVFVSAFLQIISGAIVGYLLFYLKFSKISPWVGSAVIVAIGLLTLILTIVIPFNPYLQVDRAINWDIPLSVGVLRLLMFVPLLPMGVVCIAEGRKMEGETRSRFLAIGVLFLFGFLISPSDFILNQVIGFGARGSDIAMASMGFLFLAVVLAIQRNAKPTYVKKI